MELQGTVAVIAHRGASAHRPEHTLEAYDLALEMGANVLEIDIRLTSDLHPVVVHDRTLTRTTGDPRSVGDLTLAELWELESDTRPLGLHEIFARYGNETRYLVDLKAPAAPMEQIVSRAITRHKLEGNVMVQTFSRRGLKRMRRCHPQVALAQLYPARTPSALIRADLPRIATFADAIGPEAGSVDAGLIDAAHRAGLRVQPWTVNDIGLMSRLVARGVDGLITDAPDRARSVVDLPGRIPDSRQPLAH